MTDDRRHEDFQYWLADMDDAIERFFGGLSAELRALLDLSPASLNALEAWILERYSSTQEMLASSETAHVDGLARYIGETFRGALGGRWEIRLDDPKYVFYGKPQLTDFWGKATPVCPLTLATASADRRTGTFLSDVLGSYMRDKERGSSRL